MVIPLCVVPYPVKQKEKDLYFVVEWFLGHITIKEKGDKCYLCLKRIGRPNEPCLMFWLWNLETLIHN